MPVATKVPYICGALTKLSPEVGEELRALFVGLAEVCERVLGLRAFVPHEHCDPKVHPHLTPREVEQIEREQVCNKTSLLVVVTREPSWGGGIEVEMAYRSTVPVVLLASWKEMEQKSVSRLLRGNPAVVQEIVYNNVADALTLFEDWLIANAEEL